MRKLISFLRLVQSSAVVVGKVACCLIVLLKLIRARRYCKALRALSQG